MINKITYNHLNEAQVTTVTEIVLVKDTSRDTDKKDSSHDDKQDNLQPFERSTGNNGNRNRASERYHIPHKKAVKEQQQRQDAEDKENFATPLETPIRRQRSRKGQTAPEA